MKRFSALIVVLAVTLWFGNAPGLNATEVVPEEGGCVCLKTKTVCDNMSGKTVCWTECVDWLCDNMNY